MLVSLIILQRYRYRCGSGGRPSGSGSKEQNLWRPK